MNAASKETTPFILFKHMVAEEARITVAKLDCFSTRLHAAFDAGEPVWMVADEMRLRSAAPAPRKTPRQLAVRVVKFA